MAEGIEVRHTKDCGAHRGRRCTCTPTYRASIWAPAERKLVRKVFASKIEAQLWRADAAKARKNGALRVPDRMTVAQAADALVAGMKDGTVLDRSGKRYKPASIRSYENAIENAIKPTMGAKALEAVTRGDVQAFVDDLHAEGLSASTVRNRLDPLRVIFRRARRRGLVSGDPTRDLELPQGRGRRERVATRQEAETLVAALPASERALWATAFYAGLRRGELRALRWSDVNLVSEPALIHVRRTWDDVEGEVTAKSEAGIRTVPLTGRLRTLIVEHGLTTNRAGDDLVFGRTTTLPFVPSTIRRRALTAWGWQQVPTGKPSPATRWEKARPDALDPLTPHEARHCCASYLIEAGLNDLELTATIGHSDPRTTKMIYGHLFADSGASIAAKLDAYHEAGA